MSEVLLMKAFDPETNMHRQVRMVKNPVPLEDLTQPVWPDASYSSMEEYYLTRFQSTRDTSAEFNLSIRDKASEQKVEEEYDGIIFAYDDLLNRFIHLWRTFEYMADNPHEQWGLTAEKINHNRDVSQSMLFMYHELGKLQDKSDNVLLDTIRYFMMIAVRRIEMEHPVRKLKHEPMETQVSHVLAIQAVDLFLLRLGIDILRVPFSELVATGDTDFQKEQFATLITKYNS